MRNETQGGKKKHLLHPPPEQHRGTREWGLWSVPDALSPAFLHGPSLPLLAMDAVLSKLSLWGLPTSSSSSRTSISFLYYYLFINLAMVCASHPSVFWNTRVKIVHAIFRKFMVILVYCTIEQVLAKNSHNKHWNPSRKKVRYHQLHWRSKGTGVRQVI